MRRGDVFFADLSPVGGSEAAKRRPVVVVSNDAANQSARSRGRGVVTVVPITNNVARVYAFQVRLAADPEIGLTVDSKAQAEQVRSVDVSRLTGRLGALSSLQLGSLDNALRLHLAL
jgi:mRNA interferase MazF